MNNIRIKLLKLFVTHRVSQIGCLRSSVSWWSVSLSVPDGVSRVDWVPTDAILLICAPDCYPEVVDKVKQDRWDDGETRKIQVWFFFPTREVQVAVSFLLFLLSEKWVLAPGSVDREGGQSLIASSDCFWYVVLIILSAHNSQRIFT